MEKNSNYTKGQLYVSRIDQRNNKVTVMQYIDADGSARSIANISFNDYKPSEFELTPDEAHSMAIKICHAVNNFDGISFDLQSYSADKLKLKDENTKLKEALTDLLSEICNSDGDTWEEVLNNIPHRRRQGYIAIVKDAHTLLNQK